MHHFLGSAGRSAHPTLETWCPATKEQGLAGSGAPRPTGGRPTDAGPSLRRQPNLVPEVTQTPTGALSPPGPETEKSEPVARAWCRIPRRPEAPAGRHSHPALSGRSLIQTGAGPTRPAARPIPPSQAGGHSSPPAHPEAHLRPLPGSVATARPVNQKTGAARGQSLFYLHSQSCGSAGFFRCLYSCSYAGFLPSVKPYFTRV